MQIGWCGNIAESKDLSLKDYIVDFVARSSFNLTERQQRILLNISNSDTVARYQSSSDNYSIRRHEYEELTERFLKYLT